MIAAFLQLPGFPRSTEERAFSLYFCNKKCMQVKSVSRLSHHQPAFSIAHHSPVTGRRVYPSHLPHLQALRASPLGGGS